MWAWAPQGWHVVSDSFCFLTQIYGYDELQMLQSRLPMVSGVWERLGGFRLLVSRFPPTVWPSGHLA